MIKRMQMHLRFQAFTMLFSAVGLLTAATPYHKKNSNTGLVETSASSRPLELDVMSFNIRNGRAKDGENQWNKRKDLVCDLIRKLAPDVVGIQEAYHFQLQHLLAELKEYATVGTARDGGTKGE